ncbi:MAG: hypothetical protein WD066_19085 [Planctomycetaceae bacterium]
MHATRRRRRIPALIIAAAPTLFALPALAEDAPETELGKLAASMKPGEWAELKTQGLVEAHRARGASGAIFGYNEGAAWDPNSRQWLYCGGDHNDRLRFVTYSADTNAWTVMENPPWSRGGTSHGYDHNTIDEKRGIFYYRPFSRKEIHRYDIAEKKWSSLPPMDTREYIACCTGVTWFPELEGIVVANSAGGGPKGHVLLYTVEDEKWTQLGKDLPMGVYHTFSEYSPVHKVVIFGGGNGSSDLHKLDAERNVTTLKKSPLNVGTMQTIITADPVSGDYLVFGKDGSFHVYDVTKDEWTKQDTTDVPIFKPTRQPTILVWHVTASPVSNYGVTMFVKYVATDEPRGWVYLYKHADK